jgi:hypothetical protein
VRKGEGADHDRGKHDLPFPFRFPNASRLTETAPTASPTARILYLHYNRTLCRPPKHSYPHRQPATLALLVARLRHAPTARYTASRSAATTPFLLSSTCTRPLEHRAAGSCAPKKSIVQFSDWLRSHVPPYLLSSAPNPVTKPLSRHSQYSIHAHINQERQKRIHHGWISVEDTRQDLRIKRNAPAYAGSRRSREDK